MLWPFPRRQGRPERARAWGIALDRTGRLAPTLLVDPRDYGHAIHTATFTTRERARRAAKQLRPDYPAARAVPVKIAIEAVL